MSHRSNDDPLGRLVSAIAKGPPKPPPGASTDELIAYHQAHSRLDPAIVAAAIPVAIDALYSTRDAGGTMHDAGAAAAVAALEAARRA